LSVRITHSDASRDDISKVSCDEPLLEGVLISSYSYLT